MAIISARHLVKQFDRSGLTRGGLKFLGRRQEIAEVEPFRAVNDISFEIADGEFVGYVGPNGAGKSTTIKMLTGILVPTSGQAEVAGLVPWDHRKALAQRIGVVFGQRTQLWWDLALNDSLELLRHMYRVPEARFRQNFDAARELLGLDEFLQTPVRQLSLGQRMRGDLAAALLHDPRILYLDEPTIGLDVVAKARIREFLLEMNRDRGVTILLTTHDLGDIEQLCNRLMIIDHGRLMYDGSLDNLKRMFGTRRQLVVDFSAAPQNEILSMDSPFMKVESVDGPRATISFDGDAISAPDVLSLAAQFGQVQDMTVREPEIETIIRQAYAAHDALAGEDSR